MAKQKDNLNVRIIKDSALWQYMPDPNTILCDYGTNLHIYDKMKQDGRIGSLFDDRRNATHNLAMSISTPEDEEIKTYSEKYLSEASLRKWGFYLLDGALTYGFRPAEITWKEDKDGYMYIDGIIGHDICKYRYNSEGQLFYGQHECSEPYKWITHANEGDSLNRPYGRAYLKRAYWAWKFKKLGWEFWINATEKFAVPSLIALFDQSDPTKAQNIADNLADLIRQVSSGSGGALANVKGIQQISMGGSVSDFDTLITACDLQIAYALTGQALATNISDTGTQALGTVQERTKASAYENDSRALAYTLNKLVSMAIEVNFGSDSEKPLISFDTEDYATFSEVMQAYQQGVPISRKALYSRYGLPEPEDEDDAITYTPSLATGFDFADTGKKKIPYDPTEVLKSEAEKAKKIKDIEDKYFDEISESIDKTLSELKKKIDKNPDILSDDAFTIWKPKVDEKLIEATYKALMEAWLRGISHRKDGDSSDFADISLSFDLKYEDAIKIAGLKEAVTPKEYKDLSAHIKQQAFTVGRLAQLDMVKKAKSVYLKAIDADKVGDIGSFIRDMATVDSRASGMVGYYSLVYRTNIQSDYNAAKALSMEEDPPKYLQFVAIEDERTTDICSARAGITLPYDDPFWKSNWPPLHYNCRSTVRELDEDEVEAMGLLKDGRFKGRKPKDIEVPQSTFGHKPTKEDTGIWSMSRSQAKRIDLDSLNDELNQVAKETTCSDFSEDKEGYITEATDKGGLRYQKGIEEDAIAAAKSLVENEGCFIEIGSDKAIINGSDTIEIVTSSSLTSKAIASEITKAFSRSGNVLFSVSKENKDALKKAMKSIQKKISSMPSAKRLYIIIEGRSLLFLSEDLGDTDKLSLL